MKLRAPFPWFGGKFRASEYIWPRLSSAHGYVEPFAGSLAVLLANPSPMANEVINDLDCYVANFWRALQRDPEGVIYAADNPSNEADLTARHIWLVNNRENLTIRIQGDPDYYDSRSAGWWAWGLCCWVGGRWCSGSGPWNSKNGRLVNIRGSAEQLGVSRQLVNSTSSGLASKRDISSWLHKLANRLRHVKVLCGDWSRVLGYSYTQVRGPTIVFLDPPYDGFSDTYATSPVWDDVVNWCRENANNPKLWIVLCGYQSEDNPVPLPEWEAFRWRADGGYGNQSTDNNNRFNEHIWFSPHCPARTGQLDLYGEMV